jgi:preprotein translocase subunit SecA
MAGRGTDIRLGNDSVENAVVASLGGLLVIGAGRNDTSRGDAQLTGRAGRAGDAGEAVFHISPDDLVATRRSDMTAEERLAAFSADPVDFILRCQRMSEAWAADTRAYHKQFSDVDELQRAAFVALKDEVGGFPAECARETREAVVDRALRAFLPIDRMGWDGDALSAHLSFIFGLDLPISEWLAEGLGPEAIRERSLKAIPTFELVADLVLPAADALWRSHAEKLDTLRRSVFFRSYGHLKPLNEYRREAFEMFRGLIAEFEAEALRLSAPVIKAV